MTTDQMTFPLLINFACEATGFSPIMTERVQCPRTRIQEPAMRKWLVAFVLVLTLLGSAFPASAFHRGFGGWGGHRGFGYGGYRGFGYGGYRGFSYGGYRGFGFGYG